MARSVFAGLTLMMLTGCGATRSVEPLDHLSFAFEARLSQGEIWVMPPVAAHAPIELPEQTWMGMRLQAPRTLARQRRSDEIASLPEFVAQVLPGEVNARLGPGWNGQFRHAKQFPSLHAHRLADAVRHRRPDLHAVLENFAHEYGEWVLLTWVTKLTGEPLIRQALPGEVVETPSGKVVVDFADDPHLITATLGLALLSPDGEVVIRYEDGFHAVLSGTSAPQDAAHQLAKALVDEVSLVWMTEGRLVHRR